MAKIIYALSGQGRGHSSRVLAVSEELRRRGHEVVFCCGGQALEILESDGKTVIPVPALRQILDDNEIRIGRTIAHNCSTVLRTRKILADLAERFSAERPDLLITDFEAFSPRAAARIGLPVLSFNHQQVVTETRYKLPPRYWYDATLTAFAINNIAPADPEHILLTSFYFPPLRHPEHTTLVAPIIRTAVQELKPSRGEHVLVYYNQPEGTDWVLEQLDAVGVPMICYNFPAEIGAGTYRNLTIKKPSLDGFLADLSSSRAVICTAGYTLISESLYLGKPVMVVPNKGVFEQTLNALFLQREGLGRAVLNRSLRSEEIRAFLDQLDVYAARLQGRRSCGNDEAVACIEGLLARNMTIHLPRLNGNGKGMPLEEAADAGRQS